MRTVSCLLVFVFSAVAQNAPSLDKLVYPPLARAARVEGTVIASHGKVVSGPPLLARAVEQQINLLELTNTDFIVHFASVEVVYPPRILVEKRGDAFDRLFLRILRAPTVRKVKGGDDCSFTPNIPANRVDRSSNPIEVFIYAPTPCLIAN